MNRLRVIVISLVLLTGSYGLLAYAHVGIVAQERLPADYAKAGPAPTIHADSVVPIASSAEPPLPPLDVAPGLSRRQAEDRWQKEQSARRHEALLARFREGFAAQGYRSDLGDFAAQLADEAGMDLGLLYALIDVESSFDCGLVSHNRNGTADYGCMQLNDSTWPGLAAAAGIQHADPLHPEENLRMGIGYLAGLYRTYGSWVAALSAYNMGDNGLARIRRETGSSASKYSELVRRRAERVEHRLAL